jgi:prepilin peptidase CpaA
MIALAALCVFAALLLWAAASDIATMEIPNRISILMAGLYPLAALVCGLSWAQIGVHVATGAGMLLISYLLFNLGVFGGGDAKVIAAAAIWTGPATLLPFLMVTAMAGGVLTAAIMGARAAMRPADSRPAFVNRLLQPTEGVPYAVAIAAGGFAVVRSVPLWLAGGF